MKKSTRYILYLVAGVVLYYGLMQDDSGESLQKFHEIAPALILGVLVLLLGVRFLIEKKNRRDE